MIDLDRHSGVIPTVAGGVVKQVLESHGGYRNVNAFINLLCRWGGLYTKVQGIANKEQTQAMSVLTEGTDIERSKYSPY